MQLARSIEDGPNRRRVVFQLLPQGVDLTLFNHAAPAGPAHGVFELGLTPEESESFAQWFYVCYLLFRDRALRGTRFAGFLADDSFARARFARILRFALVARAAGRFGFLALRAGVDAAVRDGASRWRSN